MVDYEKLLNDFKNYSIDPTTLPDLNLAILDKFGFAGSDDPMDIAGKQAFEGRKGSEKALVIITAVQEEAVKGLGPKELSDIKSKFPGKVTLFTNFGIGVVKSSLESGYPNIKIKKVPSAMSEVNETVETNSEEIPKMNHLKLFEEFVNERLGNDRDHPILPLGKINLTTGESEVFNIYSEWGEDTTYEIYDVDGKYRIVATSGTEPLQEIGSEQSFKHDQNRRFLFRGKMIDSAVGTKLKALASKYGNSISGYTYK